MTSAYKRYVLATLTALYSLNLVDRGLMALLLQPIKEDLRLSDTQLGLVTGIVFGVFYATLGIPIARWADRGNRALIASLAIGLWGATVMCCLFVGNYVQLVIARMAAAVGEAGCKPPTYSLVGDYFPGAQERTRAMAVYWIGSPVGLILSFMLGGWLNAHYGWRMTFFLMGMPGLALAIVVKMTIIEPRVGAMGASATPTGASREGAPRRSAPPIKAVLATLWQRRSCRHLSSALILVYALSYGLSPWEAAFLKRSHGMSTAQVGFWLGLILSLGGIAGVLLGGYVANRWFLGNERGQLKMSALTVSAIVPCFVVFLTVSQTYQALIAFVPLAVAFIFFMGPVFALMQRLVPDDMRATVLSVIMLLANLIGMGIGPQIVGILSDRLMPVFGEDSLRYAMLSLSFLGVWAAVHFWLAGRAVQADLVVAEKPLSARRNEELLRREEVCRHVEIIYPREEIYRRYLDFGSLVKGGRVTPRWLPDGSSFSKSDWECGDAKDPRSFVRWKFYSTGRRESAAEAPSPDGRWSLTIVAQNLALRDGVDGPPVQLTDDGSELEFWDFDSALWNPWAPDGSRVVVLKQSTRGMARIANIDWLKPLEEIREVIALPAGGVLCRSEVFIVDVDSWRPRKVSLGDTTNHYVRILTWGPDGTELLIARYNRVMSEVEILAVHALIGTARTVLRETSETFLTHHHEVLWGNETGFTLLPDGSGFIWNSERSGWDHLYLYDLEGRLIRALTGGAWRAKKVIRVDLSTLWVYFTGHGDEERPYDTHLYRVRLDGTGLTQLTQGKGQHEVSISPSGEFFTDTCSAVDTPPSTVLRAADGGLIRVVEEADISALKAVGWVPSREYVVKAADGVTDLWVTAHFPYDWDPQGKYPVVEYIYGGPQSAVRPMDFGDQAPAIASDGNFNRALAQLGFVVVTLDARGTPGRSKAFQDVVYRRFGEIEIADHAAALRGLGERLPSLDLDRVGVWGWSWGGQFAFRALTQAPDLYKVGVCGWPAFDLKRLMLYEAYLGMPEQNPALYRAADPYALVPKLQGKLLLVGGMGDSSTQADLFKLSECLIRRGQHHLSICYPNCGHGAAGMTAEYDVELKRRFFVEHLMGKGAGGGLPRAAVAAEVESARLKGDRVEGEPCTR